jgi:hypothetical protein
MKFLALVLVLFSLTAKAGDMLGVGASFGQSTIPSYGLDYEAIYDEVFGLYTDVALYGNKGYFQPYVSFGTQGDHLSLGLACSASMLAADGGSYNTQFGVGPELGYMQNLTRDIYLKENNYFMNFHGNWFLNATFSIGLNL